MTADEVEHCSCHTVRHLRAMPSTQRTEVIEQILRADPELARVLPQLLAIYASAKYVRRLGPLLRDGVSD